MAACGLQGSQPNKGHLFSRRLQEKPELPEWQDLGWRWSLQTAGFLPLLLPFGKTRATWRIPVHCFPSLPPIPPTNTQGLDLYNRHFY